MSNVPRCIGCQAFTGVFIDDVQDPEGTAIMCLILHEIVTPDMIWILRPQPDTGPIIQPQSGAFWLFCRHFQPFFAPYSLYALVVHSPSFVSEHPCDHSVSVATMLAGQLDDVFSEHFLVFGWLANVALR
jgi:hypothetical protein